MVPSSPAFAMGSSLVPSSQRPWQPAVPQLRYWSLCIDQLAGHQPVIVNHLPSRKVDLGCRYDSQVAPDRDGYGSGAARPGSAHSGRAGGVAVPARPHGRCLPRQRGQSDGAGQPTTVSGNRGISGMGRV